jgi:hypothetical protein
VKCVTQQADLAAPDGVERIVTALEDQDLKIDLLINNAGLGLTGDFLSHDLAKELASIQVNVRVAGGTVVCPGRPDGLARRGRYHQPGLQCRISAASPYGDLRGSKSVRSPFQRSTESRTQGTGGSGDGRLPGADGDEFLRGYIDQDEGRRVR